METVINLVQFTIYVYILQHLNQLMHHRLHLSVIISTRTKCNLVVITLLKSSNRYASN